MRRTTIVSLAVVLLAVSLLAGCAAMAVAPVTGFLYTDVNAPMIATGSSGPTKVGEAFCESYLGLIAVGDASIDAAMRAGGITQVHSVDYKSSNILGLYSKFIVIVRGN